MDDTQSKVIQESEFVKMLVRSRVISEGQLKAVYDYQRSVGGSVLDILVKLNMMPRSEVDRMLQAAMRGEDIASVAEGNTIVAVDAKKLDVDALNLHHRLIDKIPMEIIERCVLTVFFPAPNLDSRKLIVGHGRELPEGLAERISSTLGVELYTLDLGEAIGAGFVVDYLERAKKPVPDEMKSLCARRSKKSAARSAVAKEEPAASNKMAPRAQAGSRSDAGAPPAARESSSTDALPENPDDETNADDTRDDLEVDSADDEHTNRDPAEVKSTQVMNKPPVMRRPPAAVASKGNSDLNIEWTALLNLLVKKFVLTHEEVRVEIELLMRNRSG